MKSAIEEDNNPPNRSLPRYFTVSGGMVVGETGRKDAEEFAGDVGFMQEYLVLLADELGSGAFTHGAMSGESLSSAFVIMPGGSAQQPNATGMLVSDHLGFREMLSDLQA